MLAAQNRAATTTHTLIFTMLVNLSLQCSTLFWYSKICTT